MQWELVILFFLIALVYSSVGFGGGSSYLALLTLFSVEYDSLRLIALLCNITVVSGSVWLYYKNNLLPWSKIWPLVIVSVPAAYIGGYLKMDEQLFFIILGTTLCLAAIAMWLTTNINKEDNKESESNNLTHASIGGSIGFLSGLVGIGGGIFLSPVLHLTHWDRAKSIAATASFFILVNSIAGVLGQLTNSALTTLDSTLIGSLLIAVFIGGQIGVRTSIVRFNPMILRRLTAVLVLYVGVRILIQYLG